MRDVFFKGTLQSLIFIQLSLSLSWTVDYCAGAADGEGDGYEVIKIGAMGRVARLGELFNFAKDRFTQISILNKEVPSYLTRRIGTPYTSAKYDVYSTYSEKSTLFSFSGDFSVSASIGIIGGGLSAGGSFLAEKASSRKEVSGAFVYETLTDTDFLEIFYDEMKDHISIPILDESDDSHVVVAIEHGANVIFEYSEKETSQSSKTAIGAALKGSFDSMFNTALLTQIFGAGGVPTLPGFTGVSFNAAAGAALNASIALKEEFKGKTMKFYGDVTFHGVPFPTDAPSMLYTISQVPSMVNRSNDGRGKQLNFYLMPIDRVRKFVNSTKAEDTYRTHRQLPSEMSEECMQALEQLDIVEGKMTKLYSIMVSNRNYLNNTEVSRVGKLRSFFQSIASDFRKELRKGVVAVRSGDAEVMGRSSEDFLRTTIKNFTKDQNSLEMIENVIDNEFKEAKLKLEMVDYLEHTENVTWVGRGDSAYALLFQLFNKKPEVVETCYIHFYTWYLQINVVYFALYVREIAKTSHVLVVDCEFEHTTCGQLMSREIHCHPFQTNPNPYVRPPPTEPPPVVTSTAAPATG